MEAHHRLDQLVDLRCCRMIQVIIWNADLYPGTVALELILVDTARRRQPSQSLGVVPVRSSPSGLPVREILEYSVPAESEFQSFDEFSILFHLTPNRNDRSAHIEIERFVLIPANLR
jgi:hypothetical protein